MRTRFNLFALMLFAAGSLQAATIPYFDNFNDDPVGTAPPSEPVPESGTFSESSDAAFSVVSSGISGNSYNTTATTDNTTSGAGINFSGVLGGAAATASNFSLSSRFQFNTGSSGNASAGIGFLGTGNTFATGYFVDIGFSNGEIRFVRNGAAQVATIVDAGTVAIDEIYTLTITGTYVDSNADLTKDRLDLSATVSGGGLSGTTTFNDSAPVTTGTFFGYRNRNNSSNINVDLDDFSVVPEPGTAALLAFGALGLLARRRR